MSSGARRNPAFSAPRTVVRDRYSSWSGGVNAIGEESSKGVEGQSPRSAGRPGGSPRPTVTDLLRQGVLQLLLPVRDLYAGPGFYWSII